MIFGKLQRRDTFSLQPCNFLIFKPFKPFKPIFQNINFSFCVSCFSFRLTFPTTVKSSFSSFSSLLSVSFPLVPIFLRLRFPSARSTVRAEFLSSRAGAEEEVGTPSQKGFCQHQIPCGRTGFVRLVSAALSQTSQIFFYEVASAALVVSYLSETFFSNHFCSSPLFSHFHLHLHLHLFLLQVRGLRFSVSTSRPLWSRSPANMP